MKPLACSLRAPPFLPARLLSQDKLCSYELGERYNVRQSTYFNKFDDDSRAL